MSEKVLTLKQTKNRALKILEYRMHSEKEIYDKLRRAGAMPEDIEEVIEFLREYNFVNDYEFAKMCAKDLKEFKKYGKKRVKMELLKKGVSLPYIENALESIEWDEEEMLYPMIKKRLGGDFDSKNIDKCVRYFIYKGYGIGEIKRNIEKITAEE